MKLGPVLREIERAAGRRFAEAGLPPDLETLPSTEVEEAIAAGTVWVALDERERTTGFALCQRFEDSLHLRELDVLPELMGRGIGGRLIEHVVEEARALGFSRITLTTFRDVPWNAPFYQRRGFRILSAEEQPTFLREIRETEERGILARWPRVAMCRLVAPAEHARGLPSMTVVSNSDDSGLLG